jgi:hypothetical protein
MTYAITQFILHECFKLKVQCIFRIIVQTSIRNSLFPTIYTKNFRTPFFPAVNLLGVIKSDSMKYPLRAQAMLNENHLTCRLYLHFYICDVYIM